MNTPFSGHTGAPWFLQKKKEGFPLEPFVFHVIRYFFLDTPNFIFFLLLWRFVLGTNVGPGIYEGLIGAA